MARKRKRAVALPEPTKKNGDVDVDRLIEFVEERPELYDASDGNYRKTFARDEAWKQCAALLNTDGESRTEISINRCENLMPRISFDHRR